MSYIRATKNRSQFGNFWKHCGPVLGACEAEKTKAVKAVDELESFFQRRGTAYLPQKAQEYYRGQIDGFKKELADNNDCMKPACGSPTSIFKNVFARATDRLSEMQADIDMAAVKQQEQEVLQVTQTAPIDPTLAPMDLEPVHDPMSLLADNKVKLAIGGAAVVMILGVLLLVT